MSPGKGEKCVCLWRWIIGFNPNGQARDISLSGCLLSEAPSAEEGVLKIVALCVESKKEILLYLISTRWV